MTWILWLLRDPKRLGMAAAAVALLVIGGYVTLLRIQRDHARAEARVSRLAFLNVEAHADTTRVIFDDSLRDVSRLVAQLKVESHGRLEAKDREAMVRADLELRVDSLRRLVERPVTVDSADVRFTTFDSDSADIAAGDTMPSAIHLRIAVKVPPPPEPARWDVSTSLAPASLTLQLSCERDRARADVVGPRWLQIELRQITQDPRICSPPDQTGDQSKGWLRRHLGAGVTLGYGAVRDSSWHRGWGGAAGLSFHF